MAKVSTTKGGFPLKRLMILKENKQISNFPAFPTQKFKTQNVNKQAWKSKSEDISDILQHLRIILPGTSDQLITIIGDSISDGKQCFFRSRANVIYNFATYLCSPVLSEGYIGHGI